MKVRTRLTVGFLIILLLIWVTVFVASNTYTEIHEEFVLLKEDTMPDAIAMIEMEMLANEVAHESMDYIYSGKEETKQSILSAIKQLENKGLVHLEHETHIGQEEQKAAEELIEKIDTFSLGVVELVNLKDQGMSYQLLVIEEEEEIHPLLHALIEQVGEHKTAYMQELAQSEEAVHEAHTSGKQILFLTASFITLLAAAVIVFTTRPIVKPLHALHKGTEIVGQGNLDYRVGTKAKDEIGQLSRAFDRMTENLEKTTTSIENLNKEITERKQAEEELRGSESKYRTLLESLPQKIFSKDTDLVYVSCNENFARDLNIKPEELPGKTDYDFFSKELAEKYRADDRRILESGEAESIEEKYIQDGQERMVQTFKTLVKDEKGKVIGVLGIFHDITEHKQMEEALKESEEKFRVFMETASDLMNITDKDGNITYVNESMVRTLGYSKEEMIGMHITQLLTKESLEKNFKPNWGKFITNGKIALDTTYATKDGKDIHGEIKRSFSNG